MMQEAAEENPNIILPKRKDLYEMMLLGFMNDDRTFDAWDKTRAKEEKARQAEERAKAKAKKEAKAQAEKVSNAEEGVTKETRPDDRDSSNNEAKVQSKKRASARSSNSPSEGQEAGKPSGPDEESPVSSNEIASGQVSGSKAKDCVSEENVTQFHEGKQSNTSEDSNDAPSSEDENNKPFSVPGAIATKDKAPVTPKNMLETDEDRSPF
jgi:hypothetical protein